ncbi:hypothetical protein HYH03_002390 [Edaphochlamys debaryana]|uniref:Trichohyalin-plectin-homology domain-containing protein n=1 Tax=Edaphochlamys debaryana TaxID=47281 RepID=A0A835YB55_9CHLO|nr:hypothetical protein HYH03_002390 [Edaphochlamys debaryana]|eukprot:KAG2499443.1 hypothetical protein HYH03_002390 [Edaphochlamys debaryana]
MVKVQRGPVGQAAEAIKDALHARLVPGDPSSPLNEGIYSALRLVEAFLNARREQADELESLKAQIKRIMMTTVAARASPPRVLRGERLTRSAASGEPGQGLPSTSPRNDAELAAAGGGRLQLYSRSSARSAGSASASVDWTLPQRTLNRKAFVRQAGGGFGRLSLVQDDLARRAEAAAKVAEAERVAATKAMFDGQMAEVNKRRAAEREARRQAQLDMDEEIRQFQLSEEARLKAERDLQASLRDFYTNQVDELHARKRHEAQELAHEHAAERAELQAEEAAERRRLEALARENAQQRERIKADLAAAMAAKAAAKAARVQEEARYNREYMAKMDADEAARRRAVEMRAEKMRRAFERGGGVALQNAMAEQARLDEERAVRHAAEVEAAAAAREKADRERRRREAQAAMAELDGQIAAKKAEREAALAAEIALREEMRRTEAAAKAARDAAKLAARKDAADSLLAQKRALAEQRRRRFHEYQDPVEERYRWLHAGPLGGTERAFNNLAVPEGKAALLSSMVL